MQTDCKHFDAVVVGLGAAGSWAAKVLTGHGLTVAAMDAGKLLSGRDLPQQVKPLSKRVRPAAYWHKLFFGRQTRQARATSFHPQLEHLYVDDEANPYSTNGGETFLWIRGRQVGGRLHTWARMALRMSEADLRRAESDGWGASWPIGYADLARYYAAVETFHGLRGGRDGLPQTPDGCVTEEGTFTEPAWLFKEKIEARWPERRVVLPRVLRDKTGPVHAPLAAALATGRLHLIPDAPVARVLLNSHGDRAVAVEYVDIREGRRRALDAGTVFLCASAIESVRILLNSRCAEHPYGVGNDNRMLGRYVLDHNFVVGTGKPGREYRELPWVSRRSDPLDLGADLDFYIPDFSANLPERDFLRGFAIQGTITPEYWAMAAFGEMLPRFENRVTLCDRTDAYGIPTVNISFRRGRNDRRMIEAQKREIVRMSEAAALEFRMPLPKAVRGTLWRIVGPEVGVLYPGLAIHECGGARMGDRPETSVVNPRNQVWEVPNLYVTDGACFPSTGCQNPTLTIMALTARACELAAKTAPAVATRAARHAN